MDLIPIDPTLVRGSHGRPSDSDDRRPLLIGDGPEPGPRRDADDRDQGPVARCAGPGGVGAEADQAMPKQRSIREARSAR